jgi:asparagine synthase (glutamine-hydrolysing)
VTALAVRAGADLTAFTASAPAEPRVDESRHATRAAGALGIPLETVTIAPERWPGLLVRAVWLHEYPLLNAGIALIEPIAARARDCGVKVLLTGEAADELLGGYDHPHPREMARFLAAPAAVWRAAGAVRRNGWRTVVEAIRRRSLTYRAPGPFPAEPDAELARRTLVARAEAAYGEHEPARRRLEAELLADLHVSNFGHLLNRMDKNAMGASVETRLPFLDPGVTRLILNLPLERRVARTPKPILQEVGSRYLPPEIVRRPKRMSMAYDLLGLIRSSTDPGSLADGALRSALEVPGDAWAEITRPRDRAPALWLWSAEIWARLFLERSSPGQVERELFGARIPSLSA